MANNGTSDGVFQKHEGSTSNTLYTVACCADVHAKAQQQLLQFEDIAINVALTVNNTQAKGWGLIINSINSRACGERCLVSALKCPFMQQTSERYGTDLASE